MHRESLAMHSQQVPQGAGASTQHPVHPAGLVGVIAGEEKARAMRRGSPNTQGNYDLPPAMQHPGMIRSQTAGPGMMPMMAGMPPMPGMGGMTPGDHAQIQMSQQMTQMMQMQMQWMQQMQQMMGNQNLSPGGMTPGEMQPNFHQPAPSMNGRPPTIQMNSAPHLNGRTMSTLTPSMASWNLGGQHGHGTYAASIAPSERSNVGLASRYRPVSTVQDMDLGSARRASTFTSTSVRPWSQMDLKATSNTRPSVSPVGRKSVLAQDDDDDDEGWAEMKAKKDRKQKSWKLRKGQSALQELYNGVP